MSEVVFVDSSILYNLLDVPHKNGERDEVVTAFRAAVRDGATFIFPLTAVVETGNTIAQLPGTVCRDRAERFAEFLRMALDERAPWAVSGVAWNHEFFRALVDGGAHGMALVEFSTVGVGGGDASILLEIDRYRARIPSATPVRLWTRDRLLGSYA